MTNNVGAMDTNGQYGFRVFYEEHEGGKMSDFCIRGVTYASIKDVMAGHPLVKNAHFPIAWGETLDDLMANLEREKDDIQQQINEVHRVKAGTAKILTRTADGVAEWPIS